MQLLLQTRFNYQCGKQNNNTDLFSSHHQNSLRNPSLVLLNCYVARAYDTDCSPAISQLIIRGLLGVLDSQRSKASPNDLYQAIYICDNFAKSFDNLLYLIQHNVVGLFAEVNNYFLFKVVFVLKITFFFPVATR